MKKKLEVFRSVKIAESAINGFCLPSEQTDGVWVNTSVVGLVQDFMYCVILKAGEFGYAKNL